MKLLSRLPFLSSIYASQISIAGNTYNTGPFTEFSKCSNNNGNGPIPNDDTVVYIPWDEFQQVTNYKIRMAKEYTSPGSGEYGRKISLISQLDSTTGLKRTFQGFLITINGTASTGYSTGKLQPMGTNIEGKGKMKQVKCQKTTDTIRNRGNEQLDFMMANIRWSSSTNDCFRGDNENLPDISFQVFMAPNLDKLDNEPYTGNIWYHTTFKCENLAQNEAQETSSEANDSESSDEQDEETNVSEELSEDTETNDNTNESLEDDLDLSNEVPVTLKFAKLNSFSNSDAINDDLQMKLATYDRKPSIKHERGSYGLRMYDKNGRIEPEMMDWNKWSTWSQCSANCGYGEMTRKRECISSRTLKPVDPVNCNGLATHTTKCIKKKCAEWATWHPWSSCSNKCGAGHKTRKRICLYGQDCIGNTQQTIQCQGTDCHEITREGMEGNDKVAQVKSVSGSSTEAAASVENNTNPEKFQGKCENRYSFCTHWHKKGYCDHRFTKWMSVNCPVVCGKCEKKKESCQDKYPISCPRWKSQNRCSHHDVFLREYIVRNCKLSCGVCSNEEE